MAEEANLASTSGETNVPVTDWTTGTLKIYQDDKIAAVQAIAAAEVRRLDDNIERLNVLLDERSVSQEKAVLAALMAAQQAVDKSDAATEKRFESVNEFRKTLSDQTNSFVTRTEADQRYQALAEKVTELSERLTRSEGNRQGGEVTIGKIYAAIAAVGAVIGTLVLLANGVFR